jgi:hypothetical protein
MADTAITELEELGAEKVSGVGNPANGTPWLLLKATDVQADPDSPHTESPEADAQEAEMTKAEADEIEALNTEARGVAAAIVHTGTASENATGDSLPDAPFQMGRTGLRARHCRYGQRYCAVDQKFSSMHMPSLVDPFCFANSLYDSTSNPSF